MDNDYSKILLELKQSQSLLYIVGGAIRDKFIGKYSFDNDYAVLGECSIELAKKFAEKVGGYFVELDTENYIARVVLEDKKHYFDFAKCVGDDIETDLSRRDFSINAIAYDIQNNMIIDPFDGKKDIEKGLIRALSEENLKDDPIRILRAFRFLSNLGFSIEKETLAFIEKNYALIKNSARERINMEWLKLLEGSFASNCLVEMKNLGLLYELFPELKNQKNVPPNLHHHLCLIDHSIESVKQFELIINDMPFPPEKLALCKMAVLFHDLGKPATWSIETIEGVERHRFIKHDEVGAETAKKMLREMKFSKNQLNYIAKMIKNHIYPSQLVQLGDELSEKAMIRFFRKMREDTPDVIFLAMADRLATRGIEITGAIINANINGLKALLKKYYEIKETLKPLPKLLSGNEIMELLNIPPSKALGKIISALKESQLSGDVTTKDEAVEFVKKL